MKVFSIEDSKELAKDICNILEVKLGEVNKSVFSDGEFAIGYNETVRGEDIYIIGSTNQSDNDNLMEILMMINAAKMASAKNITVINPYYGYARQDRKDRMRGCITSKLIADMFKSAGADHIVTIDLHATQIQGFFDFPSDNIDGYRILFPYLRDKISSNEDISHPIICSPDAGGYKRASEFASRLETSIVSINKVRTKPNEIASMDLVGDVEGKDVIVIDDIIDTAGTLCKAVSYLKESGAKSVRAVITHPVLSGKAYKNLNESELDELIVTDTINKGDLSSDLNSINVSVVSCAPELARIIMNIHNNKTLAYS